MGYYEIDEFEDVVGSLRALLASLGDDEETPVDIKWAVIAAHSALQGACVCILTQTDGTGALTRVATKAFRDYLEAGSQEAMRDAAGGTPIKIPMPPHPKPKMANLRNLAKRLPDDLRFVVADEGVWPDNKADQHFTLLSRWRDEFTHYPPQDWLIEIDFVSPMLRTTLDKIEAIAKHGGYRRRNRFEETELFEVLGEARARLP